jgi:uncharacterized protein (DUF3084 family)
MKVNNILAAFILLLALAGALAWKFWPTAEAAPAVAITVAAKPTMVSVVADAKPAPKALAVEAPRLPPAAVPAASLTSDNSAAAEMDAARADALAAQLDARARQKVQMQQMLEQFRKQSQDVLDKATANGADPAKLEATRQTYDAYMQEIQAQIDALDQAPVPTPP